MSINLDWSQLQNDSSLNLQIKNLLNSQLTSLPLPDYLSNLSITNFQLGQTPPNLTIRHIGDPFTEFYQDLELDSEKDKGDKDVQFLVEFEYKGDLAIELQVDLLLNYPSPGFIKLPVKLNIVEIGIHSLTILAYLQNKCFISFLCDVNDEQFDQLLLNSSNNNNLINSINNINSLTSSSTNSNTRIDIIRTLKIESEIGEINGIGNISGGDGGGTGGPGSVSSDSTTNNGNILRNVGKVEKFLTDLIRNMLRDEVAWPGWLCLDFDDDEDDEDDEEDQEEGEKEENSG